MKNLILSTDSYKQTHYLQYPNGMTYMHDYIESRGGSYGVTKFFGLQYYLKEYLSKPITKEMVEEAKEICKLHGVPFNEEGWNYIAKLGYLPIKIRAVEEGVVVPNHNVLITVESTDEKIAWITGFVETLIMKVWYPITVATFSYKIKKIIKEFLDKTSDNPESELLTRFHDFGYRGVSSEESAGIGGMSHLVNFRGTDTLNAVLYAKKYYNCEMAGFSIPASEHSTMTSWKKENEEKAFENMIDKFQGPVSIVSDSYNFFNAVDYIVGEDLKEKIKNHKEGPVIIRPDSGDAITNVLFALESLERNFGAVINSKGFKVLNAVRIIQGDGINEDTIWDLCKIIMENGYSIENVAFGCGGALLQGNSHSSINRDTHRFAMKCSAAIVNGELIDIYKNPITDRGKVSKKGILDLIYENGEFKTINIEKDKPHKNSVMKTVFENGKILKEYTFDEVRNNENKYKLK